MSVGDAVYSTRGGEVRADSFGFEANRNVNRNLMVTAAFSAQHVHNDSTGEALVQSGRGNASLFAIYTMPNGRLKGVEFGGGLRYEASAYGGPTAPIKDITLPRHAVFAGALRYDLSAAHAAPRGRTLSALGRNILDKRYIASLHGPALSAWAVYGDARNALAAVTVRPAVS